MKLLSSMTSTALCAELVRLAGEPEDAPTPRAIGRRIPGGQGSLWRDALVGGKSWSWSTSVVKLGSVQQPV